MHASILELASVAVEAREAAAGARVVVAQPASRAVSARLVAVPVQGVRARGAGVAAVARVAQAAHVLHDIPGRRVGAADLGHQVLLGPAGALEHAVVGAGGALAGRAVVAA